MKKILLLCVCLGLLASTFAQRIPANATPLEEKQAYLHKSRKLWTVALIVVGAGTVMAVSGILIANRKSRDYNYSGDENTGGRLFIAGCVVMISSMAFSIPAGVARRRAKGIIIAAKNEPSLQLQQGMMLTRFVPSLNLRMGLGKPKSRYYPLPQL